MGASLAGESAFGSGARDRSGTMAPAAEPGSSALLLKGVSPPPLSGGHGRMGRD